MRPLLSLLTSICLTATLSHAPLVAREVHGCCTPLEQIQTHLELLTLYLQQQKLEAARKELFNAQLLLDLHYPQLLNQYAFWKQVAAAHARLGNTQTAYALYARLFETAPPSDQAELALNLGQLALQQSQQKQLNPYDDLARTWLRRALGFYQRRGETPPPVLAYLFWAAGESDQAYTLFTRVFDAEAETSIKTPLPIDPAVLQTWYLAFAETLLDQDQPEQARRWVHKAQVLRPALTATSAEQNQPLLASLLLRLNAPAAAAEIYDDLLARSPQNKDYALALAEARLQHSRLGGPLDLAGEAYQKAYTLVRQARESASENTLKPAKADAVWRALLFGLKSTGQDALAEQAFQRIQVPTAEDLLQGAYLAVGRGDEALAQQRFEAVLARLAFEDSSRNPSSEMRVVEWSATFALEQMRLKQSQIPEVYQQRLAGLTQKLLGMAPDLYKSPEGQVLLLDSAMNLGTPQSLLLARQSLMQTPPAGHELTWRRHAADLALREQDRLRAALLYEQLFVQLQAAFAQGTRYPLSQAQWPGVARGLSAVGKTRAAEVLWQEILKKPSPQKQAFQWEALQNQVRQAQQKHDTNRLKQLKQDFQALPWSVSLPKSVQLTYGQLALILEDFEASEASFRAVLQTEPGTPLARQGLALSLEGQGRKTLAHRALADLRPWFESHDSVVRDANLRLARIEVDWNQRERADQRFEALSDGNGFDAVDAVAWQARQARQRLFRTYFPAGENGAYDGFIGARQQDLFIGDQYRRYVVFDTEQEWQWVWPNENPHRPPFIQAFSVFAERYQLLDPGNGFSFQRGGLKWQQHWRHEFEQGPLFAWVTPALAYRWGLPEPLSIGINQHGHGQLQLGLQLTPQQRVRWDSDLKFGQAELYLGGFHNYGTTLRWQWRDGLGLTNGLWGVDLLTGIDNYLVLDGNGEPQGLFRQRNGIEMVYQDAQRNIDYTGRFELNPIFGSLSDTHMNTAHAFTQGLDSDWDLTYRLEAHHYGLPVQRYQNYWRAQMGVAYHLPTPLARPLSLHIGVGLIHFYQTDQPPAPQFFVNVLSQR